MPIPIQCPQCGRKHQAPDSMAGQRAMCQTCGGVVSIPSGRPAKRQAVPTRDPLASPAARQTPLQQTRPAVQSGGDDLLSKITSPMGLAILGGGVGLVLVVVLMLIVFSGSSDPADQPGGGSLASGELGSTTTKREEAMPWRVSPDPVVVTQTAYFEKPLELGMSSEQIADMYLASSTNRQVVVDKRDKGWLRTAAKSEESKLREVLRFDLTSGELMNRFAFPKQYVLSGFSPSAAHILGHEDDGLGTVVLWTSAGEEVGKWEAEAQASASDRKVIQATFAGDDHVAVLSESGKLDVFDIATGNQVFRKLVTPKSRFAVSNTGKWIIVVANRGLLFLETSSGEEVGLVQYNTGGAVGFSAAFRTDGQELAAALTFGGNRTDILRIDVNKGTVIDQANVILSGHTIDWVAPGYLLTSRGELVDVNREMHLWTYPPENSGHLRVADDGLVWFTESEYPASTAYLLAARLPDSQVEQTIGGSSEGKEELLSPGDSIRVELNISPPGDMTADIQREAKAAIRNTGFLAADSDADATFRIRANSKSTGKQVEYYPTMRFGFPSRMNNSSEGKEVVDVVHLECFAELHSPSGSEIWRTNTILSMPQPYMMEYDDQSGGLREQIRKMHWESFGRWARTITLPRMITRVDGEIIAIPGFTELIDTIPKERQPLTRAERFALIQEQRRRESEERIAEMQREQEERRKQAEAEREELLGPKPEKEIDLATLQAPSGSAAIVDQQIAGGVTKTELSAAALHPKDDDLVALLDSRGNLGILSIEKQRIFYSLERALSIAKELTYSDDGELLFGVSSSEAKLFFVQRAKLIARPIVANARLNSVQMTPDGTRIACAAGPQIAFYDIKRREFGKPVVTASTHIMGLGLSPDSQKLYVAAQEGFVVFDATTGKLEQTVKGRSVRGLGKFYVARDGSRLVGVAYHAVHVWDTNSWTETLRIGTQPPPGTRLYNRHVDVSVDANRVAVSKDDDVFVIDLNDGSGKHRFQTAHGQINDVALGPPSRHQIATVGKDGFLRVWDAP